MAESKEISDQEWQDGIMRVIAAIKKDRNRPSYEKIHAKLTTAGMLIEADDLKDRLDNLVRSGLINQKMTLRDGEEIMSFNVGEVIIPEDIQEENENCESDNDSTRLNSCVNEAFCEILTNKVCAEVSRQLEQHRLSIVTDTQKYANDQQTFTEGPSLVNTGLHQVCNQCQRNDSSKTNDNRSLVNALLSEITFLRNEMNSH